MVVVASVLCIACARRHTQPIAIYSQFSLRNPAALLSARTPKPSLQPLPTAAGQGHRQPMRRTRLALPWGMRTDLRTANSDLIVLRGLIFKAILVESEVLDAQDTGRFLMALAAASGTSFAVATAVESAFLQALR